MSGWVCSWKNTQGMFLVVPWVWLWLFHNGSLCLYSSKRWQSVSWYNLHKEHSGVKDFLKKKQFFLYWIRHWYQSKTCVEHIEQVIDKSLINSTNSFMNLLSIIFCKLFYKYCKKYMRKSNQETFNFFGRIYGNE